MSKFGWLEGRFLAGIDCSSCWMSWPVGRLLFWILCQEVWGSQRCRSRTWWLCFLGSDCYNINWPSAPMSTSSYQHIDHLVPPGRLRKLQIVRGSTPAAGTSLWHQPTMETGYLSCFIFYFQHRDVSGLHTLGLFHRQLDWSRFCLCSRFHGVCCSREWCCCARTILKMK